MTFCERVKKEFKIVKENLKVPIVFYYYLFWLVRGLKPSFSGADYIQWMEVYEISSLQLGLIVVVGSISSVVGVLLYTNIFS